MSADREQIMAAAAQVAGRSLVRARAGTSGVTWDDLVPKLQYLHLEAVLPLVKGLADAGMLTTPGSDAATAEDRVQHALAGWPVPDGTVDQLTARDMARAVIQTVGE